MRTFRFSAWHTKAAKMIAPAARTATKVFILFSETGYRTDHLRARLRARRLLAISTRIGHNQTLGFNAVVMKRDMDIVRDLLLRAEAADGSISISDPVETYHVRIMIDPGLIEGRISQDITSDAPQHSYIHSLTWGGHD